MLSAALSWAEVPPAFRSGPAKTALVELFSSEGCSSCPPADDWFSSLREDPNLFKTFVPVAYHVDYWDQLGWKDRFADPEYTAIQRRYAALSGKGEIYTPGVFRDGHPWRNWGRKPPKAEGQGGVLEVRETGHWQFEAVFKSKGPVKGLTLRAALLGVGLVSDVKAGENEGKRLVHDFVVAGYAEVPLDERGGAKVRLKLRLPKEKPEKTAAAFWIVAPDGVYPLQAAGGWL